ncbi:UGSC family (seleno)protein [Solwaraspora sp. WMMB335]|uniref:UGSC family (seleno)protein n=1 Tax=Solwaraspora sp. WMMB335 TaxID=3404118 RepID=UPI003B92A9D1
MFSAMIDPTATTATPTGPVALAARRKALPGSTVGLLANTKRNAEQLLDDVGALLEQLHGVARVVRRKKPNINEPMPPDMLAELVATCDAVVVGVGDCGSCSASAITDGIALEAAGVPAAVVCTEAFTVSADAMAAVQGSPGYHYVRTPHPVAPLSPAELRQRATAALPDIVATLSGGAPGGTP